LLHLCYFFFFHDPAPTEIYTLSLHDALPIWKFLVPFRVQVEETAGKDVRDEQVHHLVRAIVSEVKDDALPLADRREDMVEREGKDRKSTRLNSSHLGISYAVFCLKKKKKK